ncbi:MAG TPA: hypothetical protein VFA45_22940 [Actinomycetes bacterium]|nr:hypothetical protein [Actinomycetes bacterium]
MGWIQLDDGYAEHPKVVGLSDAALAMEVRGLCYVARRDTDGFVPDGCLHLLTRSASPAEVAAELVGVDRWERDEERGGYWIHDYLKYNPSSAQRQAKRDAAAERMRRLRSRERSQDVRTNSGRSSRQVRDGERADAGGVASGGSRSLRVRANTTRTRGRAPERTAGSTPPSTFAEPPAESPLSSADAAASPNGSRERSQDVRANSRVTSREVTRDTRRTAGEVPGKFGDSPAPREPTSGGSLGAQGEGVVGQPGGPSDDPSALPGQPGSTEWETARRMLVARMLARGETPRHATPAELETWHATGRLPWDDPSASPAGNSEASPISDLAPPARQTPSQGGRP